MIKLNIGLNVGKSEPTRQLSQTLKLVSVLDVKTIKIRRGQWTDENKNIIKERTLVCSVNNVSIEDLEKVLQIFCSELKQDAISYYNYSVKAGKLVYRLNFEGERYNFDVKQFIM